MAKTNNPLFRDVSGTIGKLLTYKKYYDKTVLSKVPNMSNRVLSEKQLELNERMRLANRYAKSIYKVEANRIAERVRLKLPPHKSLYHALVREWLNLNMQTPLQELKDNFGKTVN
jgi:hypothetical protein